MIIPINLQKKICTLFTLKKKMLVTVTEGDVIFLNIWRMKKNEKAQLVRLGFFVVW